ncbi:transposase [Leptospira borgpetersenii]|uniref:transposase n=1 Tax=Leptospira borgpetersenii TaxID=174 RepID=UPI0009B6FA5C|nr:transposase [Leptospira borgpetersenii]
MFLFISSKISIFQGRLTHSKLKPIIRVAKTIKENLKFVLACSHRTANVGLRSVNSIIQRIKSNARGFKNFQFFHISSFFYFGD